MTPFQRIAAKIAAAHQIDPAKAEALVEIVVDAISWAVLDGDQFTLPGLGRLRTVTVAERRDYHPSSGAPITTPGSTSPVFQPSPMRPVTAKVNLQPKAE